MRQIIQHFTDNDLYTFTVMYYVIQNYPRAEVQYKFFDRNNTIYPKGFAKMLKEQMEGMKNVIITDEEIAFMKQKCYYLPEWFFLLLKGYRFNPNELTIEQDEEGHLSIDIKGKWYSTIMWEMPILSTISELSHILNGDIDKYNVETEYQKSYNKMMKALTNGLKIGDMGTRRRFSFEHQDLVIKSFVQAYNDYKNYHTNEDEEQGIFTGTSNVYLGMKYNLPILGTTSHQTISFEENVTGVFECNNTFMTKWNNTFDSDNGIMLYDCFGDKVFFNNFSKKLAKAFDGLRVDSGNEEEQVDKIIQRYNELSINPKHKKVVFSNGLNIDRAIEIHKYCQNKIHDSYGIGTHFTCDVSNCKPSNIVIKLIKSRITESREWHDCVKLSCDKGKTLGNQDKCNYLLSII